MDKIWILSSQDFLDESILNKSGKNAGKRSIWFNGKNTKAKTEHGHARFDKYLDENFSRLQ